MATYKSMIFVYHPKCEASIKLLSETKDLKIEVEYVNLAEDKIETKLNVDIIPLIIIDNSEELIFKGKDAFDKINEIKEGVNPYKRNLTTSGGLRYGKGHVFVEEESSGKKKGGSQAIDLNEKPNV